MTNFLEVYVKNSMPEPQLAAWLVEIKAQIATLDAAEKDYGRQVADLDKLRSEMMMGKIAEYALGDLLPAAESFMDEFLISYNSKKEIHTNLSRALTKLRSQQLQIRQAHDGYYVGRRNVELQAEKDAAHQMRERQQAQHEYERMRSKKAYEGDQDAINWPDDVEDYEALMDARKRGEETARRADQDARQARQEADAASLTARIEAWFGKFAEE